MAFVIAGLDALTTGAQAGADLVARRTRTARDYVGFLNDRTDYYRNNRLFQQQLDYEKQYGDLLGQGATAEQALQGISQGAFNPFVSGQGAAASADRYATLTPQAIAAAQFGANDQLNALTSGFGRNAPQFANGQAPSLDALASIFGGSSSTAVAQGLTNRYNANLLARLTAERDAGVRNANGRAVNSASTLAGIQASAATDAADAYTKILKQQTAAANSATAKANRVLSGQYSGYGAEDGDDSLYDDPFNYGRNFGITSSPPGVGTNVRGF